MNGGLQPETCYVILYTKGEWVGIYQARVQLSVVVGFVLVREPLNTGEHL